MITCKYCSFIGMSDAAMLRHSTSCSNGWGNLARKSSNLTLMDAYDVKPTYQCIGLDKKDRKNSVVLDSDTINKVKLMYQNGFKIREIAKYLNMKITEVYSVMHSILDNNRIKN